MSTEIDDKIVRMQFDNKNFEDGVTATIKSLENLKQSLKFDTITTGVETMASGIQKISFANITNGVEQCVVKIPMMGTVLDQTLRNMTNSVESFVKSSLDKFSTLGNAKSGFGEYELQVGAVKTIKASTGEDVATINKYLEDLNKYADDTIYSFSDMTQNIGKFTNAGVKLEDSVNAIKGVANVAALSGANTQEASRAMYNFAQALSAGSVKLIDWKSIENANMATVEFKNELIKTGLELGTLRQEGNKYVTTTTDLQGKVSQAFDATSNFNDALSHQWMTTDVLVKTLNKYTDTTTEIGQKATEAATKVNTFTQAMDAIVEDLGSNWTESWKYIVGDFEEATKMWTTFKDAISGLFKPAAEARNKMLKFWSQNRGDVKENTELTEEQKKKYQELFDVAKKGFLGDFGNGADRMKALTEAGYDYAEVQGIINKLVSGEVTSWEDVAKAAQAAESAEGSEMTGREMFLKGISNLWETFRNILWSVRSAWHEVFPRTTGEQLVAMSKAFMEFTERIKMNGVTMNNLRRTLRGVFALLDIGLTIIKAVLNGIGALFSALTAGEKDSRKGILAATANLGDLIFKLDQLIKESGIFEAVFVGIGKVIGTVGNAIIKVIGTVLGVITTLFKKIFGLDKEKVDLSSITDSFKNAATDVGSFTDFIVDKIKSFASVPVDGITTFAEKIKNSFGIFSKAAGFFSKVADFFAGAWNKIKMVGQMVWAFLSPFVDMVKKKLSELAGGATTFEDWIKFFKEGGGLILIGELITVLHTLKKTIGSGMNVTKSMSKMFDEIGNSARALTQKVKAAMLMQIATAIGIMVAAVIVLSKMDPAALTVGLGAFTLLMIELNSTLTKMGVKELAGTATTLIALGAGILMLTAAVKSLGKAGKKDAESIWIGLTFLELLFVALRATVNQLGKGQKDLDKVSRTLLSLAVSINLLMVPILLLGRLDTNKTLKGIGILGIILAEVVLAIGLLQLAGRMGGGLNKVSRTLISLTVAIGLLLAPLMLLTFLPEKKIKQGVALLAVMLLAIGASLMLMSRNQVTKDTIRALLMMTVALGAMLGSMAILAGMSLAEVYQGGVALAAMVALLVIFVYAVTKICDAVDIVSIIATLGAIVGAIGIMALIVTGLSKIDSGDMKTAMLGMIGLVVCMLILSWAISKIATAMGSPKAVAGAGALTTAFMGVGLGMVLAAVGILLFIAALDKLSKAKFNGNNILKNMELLASSLLLIIEGMIGGIIGAIVMAIPAIVDGVLSVVNLVMEGLDNNIGDILEHVGSIIDQTMDFLKERGPGFAHDLVEFILEMTSALAEDHDKITQIVENVVTIVCAIIDGLANKITDINDSIVNLIFAIVDDLANRVYNLAKYLWDEVIRKMFKLVGSFIRNILINPIANLGKKIIGGLIGGIIDGFNSLAETIVDGIHDFCQTLLAPLNWAREKIGLEPHEIPSWDAPKITKPAAIDEWQALAKGGQYNPSAIVGEAGPELLSSRNGKAIVTPLTSANAKSSTKEMMERYTGDISKQLANINSNMDAVNTNTQDSAYDDTNILNEVGSMKDSINALREDILGVQIMLDTGVLVGQMAKPMDKRLGQMNKFASRRTGSIKTRG